MWAVPGGPLFHLYYSTKVLYLQILEGLWELPELGDTLSTRRFPKTLKISVWISTSFAHSLITFSFQSRPYKIKYIINIFIFIGSLNIAGVRGRYGGILVVEPPKYPHIPSLPRRFPKTLFIVKGETQLCQRKYLLVSASLGY